jgi:hypothetical protein
MSKKTDHNSPQVAYPLAHHPSIYEEVRPVRLVDTLLEVKREMNIVSWGWQVKIEGGHKKLDPCVSH